ncbi:hypothetical protein GIB67_013998 [Kingdonia uniflora]|uniref:Ubiquitin receptor RAD23 n=1 Tax=Kingdonia uniflora TaxID=39325 RepID=A0A7J7L5N2_9MAGN|nr:hypothetical protein GIB67_013998 [Kingdonia uniflora]
MYHLDPQRAPTPPQGARPMGTDFQWRQWAPGNPFADDYTFWGDSESGKSWGYGDRYGFHDRKGRGHKVHPINFGFHFRNDGYQSELGIKNTRINVLEFDGKTDGDEFIKWLNRVDRVLAFKRCGDPPAVTLMERKLIGYALNWWKSVQQLLVTVEGDYITEWDTMRRELMLRFIPVPTAAVHGASKSTDSTGTYIFMDGNFQCFLVLRKNFSFPVLLQPMLQELSKQNPQLLRLIQEHHAEFLQLINEPVDGAEGDLFEQPEEDMPHAISVTPAEQEAIERLEAMGFDRALVIEAFLACDRNEELAVNYLLENASDFQD